MRPRQHRWLFLWDIYRHEGVPGLVDPQGGQLRSFRLGTTQPYSPLLGPLQLWTRTKRAFADSEVVVHSALVRDVCVGKA